MSGVVISLNGIELVKVGSWLFIDFMGALVARGIHTVVSEICADTFRDRYVEENCLVTKNSAEASIFYSPFIFEDERGCAVVGEAEHAFLYSGTVYQYRLSLLNYSISNTHPLPLLFLSPFPYIHSSLLLSFSSPHLDNCIGFLVYSK